MKPRLDVMHFRFYQNQIWCGVMPRDSGASSNPCAIDGTMLCPKTKVWRYWIAAFAGDDKNEN
jgi:hypothetical protein